MLIVFILRRAVRMDLSGDLLSARGVHARLCSRALSGSDRRENKSDLARGRDSPFDGATTGTFVQFLHTHWQSRARRPRVHQILPSPSAMATHRLLALAVIALSLVAFAASEV